jgi:organic hydroperoxide reductase OsmC/OhrA
MLTDCLYQASATARGGREGQAATSDGSLHAWLDLPAELGGRGHGNNPEQLFAAGYAACFLSTLKTLKNQGNVAVRPMPRSPPRSALAHAPMAASGWPSRCTWRCPAWIKIAPRR